MNITLVEPARRHKCEICKEVFICHLCTIGMDSDIHRQCMALAETKLFVCEECCQDPMKRYQHRDEDNRKDYYTDMLTGETLIYRKDMLCRLKSHPMKTGN